jgi:hypothetical protein
MKRSNAYAKISEFVCREPHMEHRKHMTVEAKSYLPMLHTKIKTMSEHK